MTEATRDREFLDRSLAILWPPPATIELGRRSELDEPVDAGTTRFVVLPSIERPRVISDLSNAKALAAVVGETDGSSSWPHRAVRAVAAVGARLGFGRWIPGQVRVGGAQASALRETLTQSLGQPVSVSMRIGSHRANRKPVLRLFDGSGRTIAFAKLGVNSLTDQLVRDEAAALDFVGRLTLRHVRVPEVVSMTDLSGHPLLILSAVPTTARQVTAAQLNGVLDDIFAIGPAQSRRLASTEHWQELGRRIRHASGHDAVELLELYDAATRVLGGIELPHGGCHGDLTPWNLAAVGDHVSVWDWERFRTEIPAGSDKLHHRLQCDVVGKGIAPRAAARGVAAEVDILLPDLDPPQRQAALAAYLLDIGCRYAEDDLAALGLGIGAIREWLTPLLSTVVEPGWRPTTASAVPPKESMRGAARGSVANLVGSAVSVLAAFAVTVVVTRGFSTTEAGQFFSATSLFLLVSTLGLLGADTAVVYFVAKSRELRTEELIPRYVRAAVVPVVSLSIALGVLTWLFAPEITSWVSDADHDLGVAYLRTLAVFIPAAAIEAIALSATRGFSTMRPSVVVDQFLRIPAQLVFVATTVLVGAQWLALAWVAPYLPAAVAAWWWWQRVLSKSKQSRQDEALTPTTVTDETGRSVPRAFWAFSAPRAVAGLGQIAIQRLDILLVAALSGATQAAIYTAATRFIVVGQMGNVAIISAVQPRLARALTRADHTVAQQTFRVASAWIMLITWPLFLTFLILGPVAMRIFGPGYETGHEVLAVLAVTMMLAHLCGIVDMVLIMGGRPAWTTVNVAIALALNIGIDLVLIPDHGMLGAAIGWAVAILAQNLLALIQVGLIMHMHPFGREAFAVAALALASFGLVEVVAVAIWGSTLGTLAISLVAGSLLYAVGTWRLSALLHLKELHLLPRRRTQA
ncbi:hypothetical protein BH09ACT11_BH09ACT11_07970 [soil metagenome]